MAHFYTYLGSTRRRSKAKILYKSCKKIIINPKITSLEAKKIYDSVKVDLKKIHMVYEYFKNKKVDNFDSYNQRQYNFNDLEKKLLGWQNEED